jgi:malate synthase
MSNRIEMNGLSIAEELYAFVRDEALPGTGLEEAAFWSSAAALIGEFSPQVRELLGTRDRLAAADRRLPQLERPGAPLRSMRSSCFRSVTWPMSLRLSLSRPIGLTPKSPRSLDPSWWCRC